MIEPITFIAELFTLAEDALVLADQYSGGDSEELAALRSRIIDLDSKFEHLPASLLGNRLIPNPDTL